MEEQLCKQSSGCLYLFGHTHDPLRGNAARIRFSEMLFVRRMGTWSMGSSDLDLSRPGCASLGSWAAWA